MPEPLKNLYTPKLIAKFADAFVEVYSKFDAAGFDRFVFSGDWAELELKGRMRRITDGLTEFLPDDFKESVEYVKASAPKFGGFEAMTFPEFVELNGLDDFKTSVNALEHLTKYSSSEFAVRPFIVRYGDRMMKKMNVWSRSKNHHVRRLASEGCRPRLPWAMALPNFKRDPSPILPVLEALKQDPSDYVRRSVANNLNDISKDNPDTALKISQAWHGKHPDTDWIVKHASRTLLKQGDARAMSLFGYGAPDNAQVSKLSVDDNVRVGERLSFSFTVKSKKGPLGRIRIEYAIHFLLKNGSSTRKVFKVSEGDVTTNTKQVEKSHSFKLISTRVYYPGAHKLEIIINGVGMKTAAFTVSAG